MTQTTYYTVITGKRSNIVKYAAYPDYSIKLFSGAYDDPGEASQQFKKSFQGKVEHLTSKAFERKVGELANLYRRERAKLADWNIGTSIRI
jgi:hypothetical protein